MMRQKSGGYIELRVQAFDVPFQLPECGGVEFIELYADVKKVLCKAFGVDNPGSDLDVGSAFFVQWQRELDVNPDIHDQANGSLAIGDDVVDDFMRTTELQPSDRDIEYLRSRKFATRLPDFTGKFSTDTVMSSVAAKVLLIFCVRVHVSCTRLLLGALAKGVLCLLAD